MSEGVLMPQIAAAIAAIGAEDLPPALVALLRAVTPYTYTVMFGYCGTARPLDLFDDFPAHRRKIFVTDYQDGPYLLDPFFLAASRPVPAGLYRIRDLAPDRFYQGEYFRSYYAQTGLAEEIGFFVALNGGATMVLSLMRDERPFSAKDMRALNGIKPVIEACVRRHWAQLHERFSAQQPSQEHLQDGRIKQSFQSFGEGLLTPREREIVEFTLKGHSAEATGQILNIAPGTVRIHRRNIYAKLRISSQGELFSLFIGALGQG